MANVVKLALESAVSVFGVRSQYEQPAYEVVERLGAVEVRRYAPRLAAEATVATASEEEGRNQAFRILAGYIFGGNRSKQDIAMTSPVETGAAPAASGQEIAMTSPVQTSAGGPGRWTQRFFLPKAVTRDNAPVPNDPRVKIVEIPEETLAALTFPGRATEAVLAEKKRELIGALAGSGWRTAEAPHTMFYDPPFTLPPLRRNEVAVRLVREA